MLDEGLTRRDLTALDFVTIDSASTEDMDDALYAESTADGKLLLTVAIADPTAWIAEGSKLDNAAKVRAFTNYLPGFNIPMLPRELSDDLCSLRANEDAPGAGLPDDPGGRWHHRRQYRVLCRHHRIESQAGL